MVETAVFSIFHRASPGTAATSPMGPAATPPLPAVPAKSVEFEVPEPVQPVLPVTGQTETAEFTELLDRPVEPAIDHTGNAASDIHTPAPAEPEAHAPISYEPESDTPDFDVPELDIPEHDVPESGPPHSHGFELPEASGEPQPRWAPPDHSDEWLNHEAEYEQEPRFEARPLDSRPAQLPEPVEPAPVAWLASEDEMLTELAPPEPASEPPHETWLHDAADGQPLPTAQLEPEPTPVPLASPELWQAGETGHQAGAAEVGTLNIEGIALEADQLGLAHPDAITLRARLQTREPVELTASSSGQYRPDPSRAVPWGGFAFDHIGETRTGLVAGTRILTSRGEKEVEDLRPGDDALTLRGPALLPISWIGRGGTTASPVLIEAGALGPNLPRRPLSLGPDQPIFLAPVPVAARSLVNGTTIRMLSNTEIELFHIDVGKAEVLFAEGVPLSSSSRIGMQIAG